MVKNIRFLALLAGIALALAAFVPGIGAAKSTTPVFYGITVHVSSTNIKVQNPQTKQTLSFEILPKFDRVFSANGKTTYQMRAIKAGQYVAVIYDQRALGMRHADKIYLMNNANQRLSKQ